MACWETSLQDNRIQPLAIVRGVVNLNFLPRTQHYFYFSVMYLKTATPDNCLNGHTARIRQLCLHRKQFDRWVLLIDFNLFFAVLDSFSAYGLHFSSRMAESEKMLEVSQMLLSNCSAIPHVYFHFAILAIFIVCGLAFFIVYCSERTAKACASRAGGYTAGHESILLLASNKSFFGIEYSFQCHPAVGDQLN